MALRVAIGQLNVPVDDDPAGARARVVSTVARAVRDGAQLVVLPEMAVPGYTLDPDLLAGLAEPVPGPTTEAIAEVVGPAGAMAVVGVAETCDGTLFNTAVAITGDGVVAHYRKLHLFDGEKLVLAPGDLGLPVFDTIFGRMGLCICYDLRFPEVARILALRGAELICAPAAWVAGFDRARAQLPGQVQGVLVQANLNQVFFACASQVGQPGDHRFLGCSVVVGPHGELVLGPLSAEAAAVEATAIELDRCREARSRSELITPRADRRTDVYGIVYGDERL